MTITDSVGQGFSKALPHDCHLGRLAEMVLPSTWLKLGAHLHEQLAIGGILEYLVGMKGGSELFNKPQKKYSCK